MSLTPGTRLGQYEISAQIGAGGMGEVYQATDSVLKRTVALKVLPLSVTADPDRLARFQREAEMLAALNHPNVAAIYGVESSGPARALVMEFVDGPTLADRIAAGAMAAQDAVAIARQIADGLEAAHERGIVHRDLKPANIKVRDDDTVKVLDFGLAKAMGPEGADAAGDAMRSPTMTARATAMGTILGTAAYMAPEQAKGRTVDKRADIWAFGVVLYEMLAGRRAFPGDDVTETLAAVIRDTPDFGALPPATPKRLRQLIERCLVRDPKQRLRDIGDARLELAAVAAAPATEKECPSTTAVAPSSRFSSLAIGIVGGLAIAGAAWMIGGGRTAATTDVPAAGRFELTLPADIQLPNGSTGSLAISPDGRTIVFSARKGTGTPQQLWLRTLDSTAVKPLAGTEGAFTPFWSPENAHVAFFADGKLKRIDLRTSAVTTICDAPSPGGGTWNAEGTILFSPVLEGPLFRVAAGGGASAPFTTLAEGESNHLWPHFLPDGRHYLFQLIGLNNPGIYAGTIDGPDRTLVIRQDTFDATAVQYADSGHIVYVRNHQLVARGFDAGRLAVAGNEVTLSDGFGIGSAGRPAFGLSRTGVLAFRPIGDPTMYQATWFSRTGAQQGALGAPGPYRNMELSKDGRTLAYDQFTEKESSTWLMDVARGTATRFTTGDYAVQPIWFPDGDRLAYASVRDTPPNPFVKTMAGVETRLARVPRAVQLYSVTADGATILGDSISVGTKLDLWLFPTAPNSSPVVFLQTPFNESVPRLSPDGRWVAFQSDEGGRVQTYVTTFPAAGRRYPVSADGSTSARWSADGKEIIYRSDLKVMAATFSSAADGAPSIGTPRLLFTLPEGAGPGWVVANDGQRLLFNLRVTPAPITSMTVLINWPGIAGRK